MKGLEMWHVLLDEKTGQRSCYHGDLDASRLIWRGNFRQHARERRNCQSANGPRRNCAK